MHETVRLHPPFARASRLAPSPAAVRGLARARAALLACAVAIVAGCASPSPSLVPESDALRERIARGDLAGADALLAERSDRLDAKRALDLAIRVGRVDAARHFVGRAGADAELDLDGTTPLIRAVRDAPPTDRAPIVALLLEAGAQPDRADRYGRSARDYAIRRNSGELFADRQAGARAPAFAAWLGATRPEPAATGARAGASSVARRGDPRPGETRVAARESAVAPSAAASAASRTASRPPAPARAAPGVDVAVLLRQSPWSPTLDGAAAGADRVALRFHADGLADVLHRRPGGRMAPMGAASAAWRTEGPRLLVSIVSDAFVVACAGALRADGTMRLGCEERDAPARMLPADRIDVARSLLHDFGPDGGPSLLAIAVSRDLPSSDVAAPTGPLAAPSRWETTLAGVGATAACRPAAHRAREPASASSRLGDWYAFDSKRFEAIAPLSGRMCAQTVARDAALRACTGPGCRSAGGCSAGQASALAGLPGVASAWVGCGADVREARTGALAACRSDLGCDCQIVAISGRNVDTTASGACTVASR